MLCVAVATARFTGAADTADPGTRSTPDSDNLLREAEQADELSHRGQVDEARLAWRSLEVQAQERGNAAMQRKAADALADLDFLQGNYDAFRDSQLARRSEAKRSGDKAGFAQATQQLAKLERRLGQLESAEAHFRESLAIYRQIADHDREAQVLTHLGLLLTHRGEFRPALEALMDSLELQQRGASAEPDRTYHYLGLLYRALQEYDEARRYLILGLGMAARSEDPMRKAPLFGSLARVSNDAGAFADALAYVDASSALSYAFSSQPGQVFDAMERGRALFGLGRTQEARRALEECLRLARSVGQPGAAADAEFTLARIDLGSGHGERALRRLESALPTYERAADFMQILETHALLIPLLRERGQIRRALSLSEESLKLQNRVSSLQANRKIAIMEYQRRNEESDRQIELLTRDNQIKALRLNQASMTRNLGLGAIAGLGLIMLALAFRYRTTRLLAARLRASNDALDRRSEELAIAHAALQQHAVGLRLASETDELTGIPNRRTLFAWLQEQLSAPQGNPAPLALLMIDIDFFKQINDIHGHVVGDQVLVRTARTLAGILPENGLLGRFGGEEFMLILPQTALSSATLLAESMRDAVTRSVGEPRVTVSIGVAGFEGNRTIAPVELVEAADQALYRAKRGGRDRVEAVPLADSCNSDSCN
jgi:diguanylate cyclase (GGDEF)-like protein